jgi:hypothetical protein
MFQQRFQDAKRLVGQKSGLAAFILQFTGAKIEAKASEMSGNRGYGGNLHRWPLFSSVRVSLILR